MRPTVRAAGLAIGLALLAMPALAGPLAAHSLPQSSDPAPGASLSVAPTAVTITFGEKPDPRLSTIKVLDGNGVSVTAGPTAPVAADAKQLTVPLVALGRGVFTVAWRSVSAVDGHLATGSFAFALGGAALPTPSLGALPSSGTATLVGPSISAIAGRWLLFVGLVLLAGGAFVAAFVARPARAIVRLLLPFAWLAAMLGTAIVMTTQLSEAGVDPARIFDSSFGAVIVWRVVPLLAAGAGIVLAARRGGVDRPVLLAIWTAAALAMYADVMASHAATGSLAPLDMAIQWLHVTAVALWLGGLAGLLLAVRGAPGEGTARAARRFSRAATVGIVTVGTTGLLRAISEVGTFDALVGADFGRLVIAKVALFAVLAGLGALNHFSNIPAAGRSLTGLRRVGRVELLVAATVLLLSATLVNIAPPSEVAAAAPTTGPGASPAATPVTATGNDFGTSVRVRLEVTSASGGFDAFRATVTDYDTGGPVNATGLTLRFTLPSRTDIGTSRLDLTPAGTGVFTGSGGNVSIAGSWQVTAVVVNGLSSVEVPLELTMPADVPGGSPTPGPTIDVNAVPGLPTIYTVHLTAGRTVQVYLDPGTAGPNELHATFFDPVGTELAIQRVTFALSSTTGPLTVTPRMLEPGHFVADTTLAAGTYTFSVSAPAPGGDTLSTQLDLPVTK